MHEQQHQHVNENERCEDEAPPSAPLATPAAAAAAAAAVVCPQVLPPSSDDGVTKQFKLLLLETLTLCAEDGEGPEISKALTRLRRAVAKPGAHSEMEGGGFGMTFLGLAIFLVFCSNRSRLR